MTRYRCLPFDPASAPPDGARVLHFFRHGEALHQVRNAEAKARGAGCACFDHGPTGPPAGYACPYWSEDLVDSPLTALGREQIRGRGASLGPVDAVLASPASRALETAVLAFAPGVSVVALPELRPRMGRHMHSKCSPRATLAARFPHVDLSRVAEGDDRAWSPEGEPREALEDRAARFLDIAFARPERRLAVVTHFTTLLALLLSPDDPFTLGPSARPRGTPALLDCSACPDPKALAEPVGVGEARSLAIVAG